MTTLSEREEPAPRGNTDRSGPHGAVHPETGARHPGPDQQGVADPASHNGQASPAILVPLFDGPAHTAALPVARRLAQIQRATLHILLIMDPATPDQNILAQLGLAEEDLHDAVLERATGPIALATLGLAAHWPGTTIVLALGATPEDTTGSGSDSGGESTDRHSPPPTHSGMYPPPGSQHPLGTTMEELITQSPGPIVLVPPQEGMAEWRLRRILVPHDGTPTTGYAVGPALELAAHADAELIILHVTSPGISHPTEPGSMTTPRYIDQPQHEWPAWTQEFRERLCAMTAAESVAIRTMLATGGPGREIGRYTAQLGIDLVVLGWRGSLEESRAATMKEVIRDAGTPIMLLRTQN